MENTQIDPKWKWYNLRPTDFIPAIGLVKYVYRNFRNKYGGDAAQVMAIGGKIASRTALLFVYNCVLTTALVSAATTSSLERMVN